MGYYITQDIEMTEFAIRYEDEDAARSAILRLRGSETVHDDGGSHFRFVDDRWHERKSLKAMLGAWRWSVVRSSALAGGDIRAIEFEGQKEGDEDLLFKAIAPHVAAGSVIPMHGDDGARWEWRFDGATCQRVYL